MIHVKKIFFLLVIVSVVLLALPTQALAASPGKLVLGEPFTLRSGEVLNEDILILGQTVTLEEGSTVNGNIMLLGGTLSADGLINGDLTAAGGIVHLHENAVISGNFSSMGAQVVRDQNAEIQGRTNTEQDLPFPVVPGTWQNTMVMPSGVRPFLDLGWFFLRVILWGLLAMLVVMFLQEQTERVTRAFNSQPWVAGGLGIGTGLILPILLVVLALTICLIPVSVIGFLALGVAWAYGIIALGLELGKRFGRIFKQEWHAALAAGVGTFLLTLILNGLSAVLPCLGWIPQMFVGALGLGGVLLTRFGTQEYPNEAVAVQAIEAPPEA